MIEKVTIDSIMEQINMITSKGNELDPKYFADIFFDIATISGIDNKDMYRYFGYSINEFILKLQEVKNGWWKVRVYKT